jgi:hypothetical protein
MFSVVQIIVLIACAYAGGAVAEMQLTDSPESAVAFQP